MIITEFDEDNIIANDIKSDNVMFIFEDMNKEDFNDININILKKIEEHLINKLVRISFVDKNYFLI